MNDKYIKTNIEGLVKDTNSGAILNIDNAALEAYRRQKLAVYYAKTANDRITKLEDDIGGIKEMLQQLLKR
jgi:hypothetical protein